MGLMDKVKKILFDEEEVEIPVKENTLKKEDKKVGFIDHSQREIKENKEEDIIKEIKVPPFEEEKPSKIEDTKKYHFSRDREEEKKEEIHDIKYETAKSRFDKLNMFKDEEEDIRIENKVKKEPIKEHLIMNDTYNEPDLKVEKKPFKVSPVISPVFGIMDKEYVAEKPPKKKEYVVPLKKRTFGPVSFNEGMNLETPKTKEEVSSSVKEEIKEVNDTISDMINEEEITSGIENEYIDNTNIEEEFESTSELKQIDMEDKQVKEKTPDHVITVDEIEPKTDENLDDTIETDLFNLIDSMYSSDSEES